MPDERLITEIENMLAQVITLGGANEITTIVPNVVIVDANPAGLTNFCIITDPRDGDNVPAKKVPGVLYANNDLVNVLFIEGTEPIAYQQGSGSSGSAVAVSKLVSPDETIDPVFSADNSGHSTAVNDVSADNFAFIVKNTSGAVAAANEVGFINEDGEYKTTTTQFNDVEWCVVIQGGANNADIYVARRGRVTVELDGNCSIGDKLYTSTTAGQANPQSYMRPEMFAVALTANASGAGGTCEALLHTQTRAQPVAYSDNLYSSTALSDSDFNATIATLPGGAVLTYTPVSGDELNLVPGNTTLITKLRLYNSTRGTYGLISDANTGTNTVTLTATVDAGWQVGDSITLRSQTNTSAVSGTYFFDFEIEDNTEIPDLARAIEGQIAFRDTGAAGETTRVHPWETNSGAKRRVSQAQVANQLLYTRFFTTFIQRRFVMQWSSSGAGTTTVLIRPDIVYLASP